MPQEASPSVRCRNRVAKGLLAILLVAGAAPVMPSAAAEVAEGPEPEVTTASVIPILDPATGRGILRRADLAPFQMIGVHYDADSALEAEVRVRRDGVWTRWMPLDGGADDVPDGGTDSPPGQPRRVRTEPLWVAEADAYEIALPPGATGPEVHLVHESTGLGSVGSAGGGQSAFSLFAAATGAPPILLRSSWGARREKVTPTIAPTLDLAVVHHTATAGQAYSAADVPALLRGIQAYHMDANGWDDIAYNFAVDRFGRIWEARAGGISLSVQGGHAKGFNRRSVGVVVLGDFQTDAISDAAVTAIGDLLGWKLFIHGVDPATTVRRTSAGNPRFPAGTTVVLDTITGHGDTGYSSCPGGNLRARLGSIRSRAASIAAARAGDGTFATRPVSQSAVAAPLRGDFNGDARGDVFWYGTGSIPDQVWYGRADGTFATTAFSVKGTYQPLVGDFDHDGRADVLWYAPGSATDSIWFGTTTGFAPTRTSVNGTYRPVVGDFDGDLRSDVLWYGSGAASDSLWLADGGRGWVKRSISVTGRYEPVVGDFNEDDRDDVLWYGSGGASDALWLGQAGGFRHGSASVPYIAKPLVGDFAGGRGADVLWYGAGSATDSLWVSGTTGGFSHRSLSVSGSYRPVVADVDGGGRDDVVWYGAGAASDTLWRAKGDGTFVTSKPTIPFDAMAVPLDGNGDGLDDLVWFGAGTAVDAVWRST